MISSMAFAHDVSVPVWDMHNEITRAVRDALATQTAIWREAWSKRKLFFFGIRHF